MSFAVKWKNTNERLAAVGICEMIGISQGAFTRIAVLREIARISALGKAAEAQEEGLVAQQPVTEREEGNNELSTQATADEVVSGEAGSEGASGNILADSTTVDA